MSQEKAHYLFLSEKLYFTFAVTAIQKVYTHFQQKDEYNKIFTVNIAKNQN